MIIFQSALGNVTAAMRKDQSMFGYLALANVTNVYKKHSTVDVKLIRSNNRIMGSPNNEGRFACRVLTTNAGYDYVNRLSHGVSEPMTKGQTVVVSFLDGMKSEPVIIGTIHNVDTPNNILTSKFPLNPCNSLDDLKEAGKYLRVFPLQDYFKIDGLSNLEFSLHTKSFITWSEEIDEATDFENLSEKSKIFNKTLQLPTNYQDKYGFDYELYSTPKNFLAVFRDSLDDAETTWTKIFVDVTKDKGAIRITRDPRNNTLSFYEINSKGVIRLKRQLDSNKRDENNSIFSEITIEENGNISITDSKGASISLINGVLSLDGNKVLVNGINISK